MITMASKKPKYNPEDVERWVTVRGARIPIMKDGSFGVGVKDDDHSTEIVKTKEGYKLKVWEPEAGKKIIYSEWDSDKKDYVDRVFKTKEDAEIGKQSYDEAFGDDEDISKTTSKNAKYDTSRVGKKKPTSLEAFKENSNQMIDALKEGQKRDALEVHYTDMTGKTYKHYWNGVKFTTDKVKQDMAKKYGKKSGVYKASFKKPKDWE